MRIDHLDPPRQMTSLNEATAHIDTARWLADLREKAEAFRASMIEGGHVVSGTEREALRALEAALQPLNYLNSKSE